MGIWVVNSFESARRKADQESQNSLEVNQGQVVGEIEVSWGDFPLFLPDST